MLSVVLIVRHAGGGSRTVRVEAPVLESEGEAEVEEPQTKSRRKQKHPVQSDP